MVALGILRLPIGTHPLCLFRAQLLPNFGDFEPCAFKMASTAVDEYHPFLQFLWLLWLFELMQAQMEVQTLLESPPLEPCRLLVLVHETLLIMGIDLVLHSESNA
jgi:hypothetical protein